MVAVLEIKNLGKRGKRDKRNFIIAIVLALLLIGVLNYIRFFSSKLNMEIGSLEFSVAQAKIQNYNLRIALQALERPERIRSIIVDRSLPIEPVSTENIHNLSDWLMNNSQPQKNTKKDIDK
jgi:cell division protein FtsL